MESNDSFSVFLLLFDGRTDTIENRRTTGMKTVFIINPDAGKGKGIDHLQARIRTSGLQNRSRRSWQKQVRTVCRRLVV